MESVNIHEAKTRLSQLVARAQQGEGFIIAKAGKPMVRVTPIDSPAPDQQRRLGFLAGQFRVPDDFDRMGESGRCSSLMAMTGRRLQFAASLPDIQSLN